MKSSLIWKVNAFTLITALASLHTYSQSAPTLKSVLLKQLKTTHNVKEWFVPVNVALEGLTPDQANWKDGSGNHSIGQLVQHLIYWDYDQLERFRGKKTRDDVNNDSTFTFDEAGWANAVKKVDAVLTEWENEIEKADDAKLTKWYGIIANISTHNAYHTGQILYIRKQQGSWNPEKGVK